MMNFPSVKISGAFNFGRARVLWHDDFLRVFGKDGRLLETLSAKPVRRPNHIAVWDAKTALGDITLRLKCMTCGGPAWWRIMRMPEAELWSSE